MEFSILSFCFFAVFCLSSGIHLFRCWNGSARSAYTKPLLVLSLALFYVCSDDRISAALLAALLTSWAGDVLLMPRGNKWFVAGGISFFISHILFVFAYTPYIVWTGVRWWAVLPVFCIYIAVSAAVMDSIRDGTPGPMRLPMFLYLAANSVMNLFALMMLLSAPESGPALAYTGAVCFFISDCVLFLSRSREIRDLIPKCGFIIMLTYILGEALIAWGLLLT